MRKYLIIVSTLLISMPTFGGSIEPLLISESQIYPATIEENFDYFFDKSDGSLWIKFTLKNGTSQTLLRSLEFKAERVSEFDLYLDSFNEPVLTSGFARPLQSAEFRNPIYHFELAPNEQKVFSVRYKSNYSQTIVIDLHDQSSLESRLNADLKLFAGYFSIIIFALIINIFLFVTMKYPPLAYYTGIIVIFSGAFIASHFGFVKYHLLPNNIWFNERVVFWSLESGQIAILLFFKSLFKDRVDFVKFNKFLNMTIAVCAVSLIVSIFTMHPALGLFSIFSTLIVLSSVLILAGYFATEKDLVVQSFLVAMFPVIGINLIQALGSFNVIPKLDILGFYSSIEFWILASSIMLVVLLGFTLAVKYREIQNQNKLVLEDELKSKIRLLEKQNELEKLNSELNRRTLKDQMKPHFLFNSLNMVSNYIDVSHEAAQDALALLASLYRDILKASNKYTWTLSEEMNLVSRFIELQKYRFDDRVKIQVLTHGLKKHEIFLPCLLLHTFVENAVEYGIEVNPQGGVVTVEILEEDGGYRLIVQDTGSNLDYSGIQIGKGHGLQISKRRLFEMYGEDSDLNFTFSPLGSVISCWVSGKEIEVLSRA